DSLAFQLSPFFYQTWVFYVGSSLGLAGIVGFGVGWRIREIRKINHLERLNALNEQRKQIARDIHDELGAALTQILHIVNEGNEPVSGNGRSGAPNARIAAIAEEAVDNIGEIVWANNPEYDSLEDLVLFLREYSAKFFADSKVQVTFNFPESVPLIQVSGWFRRHILLLAKEALQNILKHARAGHVRVQLSLNHEEMEISFDDDGCGLSGTSSGNGLANMRQRMTDLGGRRRIQSESGSGTRVHARIPLPLKDEHVPE